MVESKKERAKRLREAAAKRSRTRREEAKDPLCQDLTNKKSPHFLFTPSLKNINKNKKKDKDGKDDKS